MFCRSCGAEISDKAVACTKCGLRPLEGKEFCPGCGKETRERAVICTACGVSLTTRGGTDSIGEERSVVVAALLNWLWSGAGNLYIGQKTKGLVFCGITFFLVIFDLVTCSFGLIFHLPYMIVMIIDAALLAGRLNKGERIGEWQFF